MVQVERSRALLLIMALHRLFRMVLYEKIDHMYRCLAACVRWAATDVLYGSLPMFSWQKSWFALQNMNVRMGMQSHGLIMHMTSEQLNLAM